MRVPYHEPCLEAAQVWIQPASGMQHLTWAWGDRHPGMEMICAWPCALRGTKQPFCVTPAWEDKHMKCPLLEPQTHQPHKRSTDQRQTWAHQHKSEPSLLVWLPSHQSQPIPQPPEQNRWWNHEVKQQHTSQGRAGGASWSSCGCPCSLQESWTRWSLKVLFNSTDSTILRHTSKLPVEDVISFYNLCFLRGC